MNWLLFHSLLFGACTILLVASAPPSADKMRPEKRGIKSSEMEDIFSDDLKRKRSQEFIMFGNQQNKPAGMVDDTLAGFVDKKSDKTQEAVEEEDDDSEEDSDGRVSNNATDMKNSKVPSSTENENDGKMSDDESQSVENAEIPLPEDQDVENYLPRNFHGAYQYEELDDGAAPQRLGENNLNDIADDWLAYGNDNRRKRSNAAGSRREHDFRKLSLLSPLDKLMNIRHGARWKRDSKLRKEDVVGLLGLLAAAEAAKQERQQEQERKLEEIEASYIEPLGEPEYSRFEEPSDLSLVADNYAYYPVRYDEPRDDDEESEETPDFVVLDPEITLNRRSNPFYPPVDYRSLGIIGSKKRSPSLARNGGLWGRLEERKRPAYKEPDFVELAQILGNAAAAGNDQSEEDDEVDESEKLYSLGELLNGNDLEEARYPLYRRLI